MLASCLEDNLISYNIFSPILYYANLVLANNEDLLKGVKFLEYN
jgi:hypothetical protein